MRRLTKRKGCFQSPLRQPVLNRGRGASRVDAVSWINTQSQKSQLKKRRRAPFTSRHGLTLLEVILSTAIFLGALTAILQIMRIGHESRLSARLDAECALRCETIMGRLVSGLMPFSAEAAPFEDNENWTYAIEIEDGALTDLLMVSVTVQHLANEQPLAAHSGGDA